MRFFIAFFVAVGLSLGLTRACFGDQLIETNGRTLTGKLVSERGDSVTFESYSGGITLRQTIARSRIKSIQRQSREGPGYCPLPIIGVIGRDVRARDLSAGLRAARQSHPRFIVLVIDSPGGEIDGMNQIIQVIRDNQDLKFIAYVKHAISAAAIVAMTCPRIYVAPDAAIGATVPWQVGPKGTPANVEAKFESAIQADMKNAALLGGHDPLWVRGMSEMDLVLAWDAPAGKKPALRLASDAGKDATIIKPAGKILTLTAPDAVRYGLAAGTANQADDISNNLGLKSWHVSDDNAAWRLMEDRAREARAIRDRRIEQLDHLLTTASSVGEIDHRVHQLSNHIEAVARNCRLLKQNYEDELRGLYTQRELELRQASVQANPRENMARISRNYQNRAQAIRDRYKPLAQEYVDDLKTSKDELNSLMAQRKQLVADAQP